MTDAYVLHVEQHLVTMLAVPPIGHLRSGDWSESPEILGIAQTTHLPCRSSRKLRCVIEPDTGSTSNWCIR
jgi:hypothetical protein